LRIQRVLLPQESLRSLLSVLSCAIYTLRHLTMFVLHSRNDLCTVPSTVASSSSTCSLLRSMLATCDGTALWVPLSATVADVPASAPLSTGESARALASASTSSSAALLSSKSLSDPDSRIKEAHSPRSLVLQELLCGWQRLFARRWTSEACVASS
jgi:hypothetical protein